jgi:hypothetical protein
VDKSQIRRASEALIVYSGVMLDRAVEVWRIVISLGTGGRVAAMLVLLNLLLLLMFLLIGAWRAIRRSPANVLNPEARDAVQWSEWRGRMTGYLHDLNLASNPMRRDAIEYFKESSAWGRLSVQYSLIVNAGAMAALPHLMEGDRRIAPIAAISAAGWFASGIIFAADCCLAAYLNWQAHGTKQSNEQAIEIFTARHRHFDQETQSEVAKRISAIRICNAAIEVTVFLGIVFGMCAWVAFIWATIRLVVQIA